MSEEEIEKIFDNIPKVESPNTISSFNSINVEDLKDAMRRLNKVPTYDDLLKENTQLKEQLQQREEVIEEAIKFINNARYDKELKTIAYGGLNVNGINNVLDILNKYKKEDSK